MNNQDHDQTKTTEVGSLWSRLTDEEKREMQCRYHTNECVLRDHRKRTGDRAQSKAVARMKLLENLFGKDNLKLKTMDRKLRNLTSDAEREEMLTVSRKRVQEMYAHYDKISNDPNRPKDYIESVYEYADGVTIALDDLFGSKCLPDNVATSEPNVDSSYGNVDSLGPKHVEPIISCRSTQ